MGLAALNHVESIVQEIRRLGFDTRSAQKAASEGEIEAWVHRYLTAGKWANLAFSQGLKREQRWWNGPLEVDVLALTRCVGTEPGMEYRVSQEVLVRTHPQNGRKYYLNALSIPPLIVEYRGGELSVRDGNTRLGAMERLGWQKCWAIIWYSSAEDYRQHSSPLR